MGPLPNKEMKDWVRELQHLIWPLLNGYVIHSYMSNTTVEVRKKLQPSHEDENDNSPILIVAILKMFKPYKKYKYVFNFSVKIYLCKYWYWIIF